MTVHRIYTEDRPNLVGLAAEWFPTGATVYQGKGVWRGTVEDAAIIEVMDNNSHALRGRVHALALYIKGVNDQVDVLVTSQDIQVETV